MTLGVVLIEIGCEELPGKMLLSIQKAFQEHVCTGLHDLDIPFGNTKAFSTPRRLALQIHNIAFQQPPQIKTRKGPTLSNAYQDSKPTTAAIKFAESCQVDINDLITEKTDKGEWLSFKQTVPGLTLVDLLPDILTSALSSIPVGKRMRIGKHQQLFTRPIRWITCLFNEQVLPIEVYGLQAGRLTYGHRFHCPKPLTIASALTYEEVLLAGNVIPDFHKRQSLICEQMTALTENKGFTPIVEDHLLNEVTGLVEWPIAYLGTFQPSFLELPEPVLITSMQNHQKCFPIKKQQLIEQFILISNLESTNPDAVIKGNEAVIDARLSDAAFYYQTDRIISLEERRSQLKHVRFQERLGSLFDKTERMTKIGIFLAKKMGADPETCNRSAQLSKSDLLTQMVGEFPELQGVMGNYYARLDQEPEPVAQTLEEQYYPRFAEDDLPFSKEGCVLALADRLDTLVGLFSIGKRPTGDKDPFSLRRQTLAILRILIEKELELDLAELFTFVEKTYSDHTPVTGDLLAFSLERLRAWEHEKGISQNTFNAVLAKKITHPLDFHMRLLAVKAFAEHPEAILLSAANKRVQNILDKQTSQPLSDPIDESLLSDPYERELFSQLTQQEKQIQTYLQDRQYPLALQQLSILSKPINDFFEHVMVMAEDLAVQQNRLKLLFTLRSLFLQIADISLL